MIQLIVQFVSMLSNGFYYLFWTSYTIGKFISWIFCTALNVLSFIWYNALEAGTIFSEDFMIFLKDLIGVIANILDAGKDSIRTSFVFLYSIIRVTTTTITELITTGNLHTTNVGQQCVNSFASMMSALKNLFVLIGNGMWFILTLLPTVLITIVVYLHQISKIGLEILCNFMEGVWTNVKEVSTASVNYFLDVPLQAIIGCGCIVLLVMYRRITLMFITWLVVRLLQYSRSRLLTAFLAIASAFRRRNNNNRSRTTRQTFCRSPETVSPSNATNTKMNDGNSCVICRDEERSVVLMPCRHMCLCVPCSGSIRTLRTCPLCRKPIQNTLSVYT